MALVRVTLEFHVEQCLGLSSWYQPDLFDACFILFLEFRWNLFAKKLLQEPWEFEIIAVCEFQVIGPDDLHDLLKELFPETDIDDNFVQDLLDASLPSGYFQSSSKPTRPKQEMVAKKTAQAWGSQSFTNF